MILRACVVGGRYGFIKEGRGMAGSIANGGEIIVVFLTSGCR